MTVLILNYEYFIFFLVVGPFPLTFIETWDLREANTLQGETKIDYNKVLVSFSEVF